MGKKRASDDASAPEAPAKKVKADRDECAERQEVQSRQSR
jgi:hypothetical protein